MELETVSLCPICEHNQFEFILSATDHTVTKKEFQIVKCKSCGFLITNPRPTSLSIRSFYASDDYVSHSKKNRGAFDFVYRMVRRFTLRWKRRLIEQILDTGSLLDYGCGTGEFLKTMQSNGWQVTGVEPVSKAREQANLLLNGSSKSVVHQDLEFVPSENYDIITLWHVLEHVHDLSNTLQQFKRLLKPNGYLLIAVPNYQSWDESHYRNYWAAYDVPRHLWHFSKTNMKMILEKSLFKINNIIPMKLDAYYVSLLSEKNKNNGILNLTGLINGTWVAYKSNSKASEAQNHSSLIYIARHA